MSDEAEITEQLDNEEEFSRAALVDLTEEFRERKDAVQVSETDTSEKRYISGTVVDVTPKPEPDVTKTPRALVEEGYQPERVVVTVKTNDGDVDSIRYCWSRAQDILSWHGDGRLCSLVNKDVAIDTEGSSSIVLPDDLNRRTSRAKHHLRMFLQRRMGLSDVALDEARVLLVFTLGTALLIRAFYIPLRYPQNPPESAVWLFIAATCLGLLGAVWGVVAGLGDCVVRNLKKLNRIDT